MRFTLVIIGTCCAAATCAVTALAAVHDLFTTRTSHGAAWTLLSAVAVIVSAAGFAAVLYLAYKYDQQRNIKPGFARSFPSPETRDLDA